MPRLFVLDVPEFAGLVRAAEADPAVTVGLARHGYVALSAERELVFDRRAAGFKPAVWYSCCSGGVDGVIAEYGRDTLRIVDAGAAA